MFLQGQDAAGFHDDPLDPEAGILVDIIIVAPGPENPSMVQCLASAIGVQPVNESLCLAGAVTRCDHQGVGRGDDNHVVQPDGRDQPAVVAPEIAVAGIFQHGVRQQRIAFRILFGKVPERRPAADIVPANIHRDDRRPVGFLHDRVVDGIGGAGREGLRVQAQEVQIGEAGCMGLAAGLHHGGVQPLQLVDIGFGGKDEHAAVPQVFARIQVGLRRRRIRFLDKGRDPGKACRGIHCGATPDVAVARFGTVRRDPERNEIAIRRGFGGADQRGPETGNIADNMIRRQQRHDGIRRPVKQRQGRDCRGGPGAAADRLQDNGERVNPRCLQLLGNYKSVVVIGNDQWRVEAGGVGYPQRGFLQHRAIAGQRQKLLGVMRTRHGP